MADVKVQDGRDDLPIFIHSELDDYGLTPIEFRVYARLARRCGQAGAHESVPNMAKAFGVSDRTVQRCLRLLLACNIIRSEVQSGRPTIYWLNAQRSWRDKSELETIRAQVFAKEGVTSQPGVVVTPEPGVPDVGGDTTDGGGVTPEPGVVVTPQTPKGTPIEGTPINNSTAPPQVPKKTKSLKVELTHDEWILSLKTDPTYSHVDIDRELGKMTRWCETNNHTPSRRRFINWINKIEPPLKTAPKGPSNGQYQQQPQQNGMGPRTSKIANRDYSVFTRRPAS